MRIRIDKDVWDSMDPADRVGPGGVVYTPAEEVDEFGNSTGYLQMAHPGVGEGDTIHLTSVVVKSLDNIVVRKLDDGGDLYAAMEEAVYDRAPSPPSAGLVGVAQSQAIGPDGPANGTRPPSTDGTIIPPSFWRLAFDFYHEYEENRKLDPVRQMLVTHNGNLLYQMGNHLDAVIQAWLATSHLPYLEKALTWVESMISTSRPSNTLESFFTDKGAWDDTYLSWDGVTASSTGSKVSAGQAPQNEAQLFKHALYLVAHVQRTAGLGDDHYLRAEQIRSWVETHVFEKWYVRAKGGQTPDMGWLLLEQANHMDFFARWANITFLLQVTANHSAAGLTNAANWPRILLLHSRLVDGYDPVTMSGVTRGIKPNMHDHMSNPSWWWWPRLFSDAVSGSGDDISHSNMLVRYISDSIEFGSSDWGTSDLDRLKKTFREAIWDGNLAEPSTAKYILGESGYGSNWIADGWMSLGLGDASMQEIFQNVRPWYINYWAQHFGHLMRNASSV